jgi:hypothetical protein
MEFNLFGFTIKKSNLEKERDKADSFVPPTNEDGAVTVESIGSFGAYLDLDASVKDEFTLITRYRELALLPEVDSAIDDIVNEAIVQDGEKAPVSIDLSNCDFEFMNDSLKKAISHEFDKILSLLNWRENAYEIFKRWYIDGRLFYHIIPHDVKKQGIMELRYIDPRQIRKVREIQREKHNNVEIVKVVAEYYVFNSRGINFMSPMAYGPTNVPMAFDGVRIEEDAVVYAHSGITDKYSSTILSNLHKAIKAINQLKMMEDALVIYRIVRAPERKMFYVDCGNLPKHKADERMRTFVQNFRNKIVYNVETGEIKDDRRFLAMVQDYFIPRWNGTNTTEIESLPGGENLGEIRDVLYFQENVYKALNVPVSRIEKSNGFQLGRSTEITRDEIKFSRFVQRLQRRFAMLFNELLKIQLLLKGLIKIDDWELLREKIEYKFEKDNYFSELKESEIWKNRLELLGQGNNFVDKYISVRWLREVVLKQNEDEQKKIDLELKEEKKKYGETSAPDSVNITNFNNTSSHEEPTSSFSSNEPQETTTENEYAINNEGE